MTSRTSCRSFLQLFIINLSTSWARSNPRAVISRRNCDESKKPNGFQYNFRETSRHSGRINLSFRINSYYLFIVQLLLLRRSRLLGVFIRGAVNSRDLACELLPQNVLNYLHLSAFKVLCIVTRHSHASPRRKSGPVQLILIISVLHNYNHEIRTRG
jgi:hypothetical protein